MSPLLYRCDGKEINVFEGFIYSIVAMGKNVAVGTRTIKSVILLKKAFFVIISLPDILIDLWL